jgi:hypothetical protein
MKTMIENLLKDITGNNTSAAIEKYVCGKILENMGKKLCEENKSRAMFTYLSEGNRIVCECMLRKYTSPQRFDYSDNVKKMEAKLKAAKKEEESNGTATPIMNEDPTVFTVLM